MAPFWLAGPDHRRERPYRFLAAMPNPLRWQAIQSLADHRILWHAGRNNLRTTPPPIRGWLGGGIPFKERLPKQKVIPAPKTSPIIPVITPARTDCSELLREEPVGCWVAPGPAC